MNARFQLSRWRKVIVGLALVIVIFGVSVFLWQDADGGTVAVTSPSPVASPEAFDLKLTSSMCDRETTFVKITGSVENIGGRVLDEVAAVGTFADRDGETVARAVTALSERMPPGDEESFALQVDAADAVTCSVTFFLSSGEKLRTDESTIP